MSCYANNPTEYEHVASFAQHPPPRRVKPWWFTDDNGKLCATVKYGSKTLELANGKSAIEVGTPANLIKTFDTFKAVVPPANWMPRLQ